MAIQLGGKKYKIDVDRGCNLFSRCLICPLPLCKHDLEALRTTRGPGRRTLEIISLHQDGLDDPKKIASMVGCTPRTVYRHFRRIKEATEDSNL